ncbi:MAG: sigma-70 family RNA polymerase sigma factor [Acidobacteria bacterium]|nr:sigma-70 family RNA polymerase sigma factor [Acidobacteriota bacterium]
MAASQEGATSDRDLMARLAAGDREALAPLMERHYPRLYRLALSYVRNPDDALDVVQETFVKAFRKADRWDGSTEAGPWLSRVAVNQSIDRWRRNRRRQATFTPLAEGDHDESLAAGGPDPDRRVLRREMRDRLAMALEDLPERQRAVVVLRHYQEMSLDEIAQTLGMRLGTVKSTLHRALGRMRTGLRGELQS